MPFFPDFSQQSLLSCSYFVKKHLYPKKHAFHLHIYYVKNAPYLKCTMLSCHFFQSFHDWHVHIWSIKCLFCQNTLYYGPKKSIRCLFFRFFTKKSMLSCLYFIQKCLFSKKHTALMPIFYQ